MGHRVNDLALSYTWLMYKKNPSRNNREGLCLRRESNPHGRCGPQDFKSCVSTSSTTKASSSDLKKIPSRVLGTRFLERKTGLEPATPTLARSCSTKWATFACSRTIFRTAKITKQRSKTKLFSYLYSGLYWELVCTSGLGFWKRLLYNFAQLPKTNASMAKIDT